MHTLTFLALGGLATLVASYMARARGSGEPELSITRVKDLEQFLRECKAFQMDHAHEYGTPENRLSERLEDLRQRFEELLGNANGYVTVTCLIVVVLITCSKGEETLTRRNHCHPGLGCSLSGTFCLASDTP